MYISFRLSRRIAAVISAVALVAMFALLGANYLRSREAAQASASACARKVAYLTFDDGPSGNTADILAALERNGAKATFFVTGQRPECFGALADEAAAGHLVALHSYSHDYSDIYSSSPAFWADIDRLQELVEAQTGSRADVLRFPGGSSNTIAGRSLMRSLVSECELRGYVYYDWNVDTRDAVGGTKSADYIAQRALSGALRESAPVILMHDGPMNTTDAAALDIIIPALREKGYALATLSELAQPVHHSLA